MNGTMHGVDADPDTPLLWVLRDILGMIGTKFGCGIAQCGVCGQPIRSCITSIDSIGDSKIATIEVIGKTTDGAQLQKAWLDLEVVQCGYCQSRQIMSASALLASNPNPSDLYTHPRSDQAGGRRISNRAKEGDHVRRSFF
jgi:isoquinoline 1-oxidoreductase subunit alpha